ncbi:ATP-binding protein [Methanobacterium spitsbergense]|uniref:AAA family ATPase n=1 Tax=Methanobacterium spitsbergense TaxID=2874285 RepID=A0A8T5UKR0_9EURY|nr:ATP-binding protein [Methanobacterium spitsbergense]MBZ2164468.1 AAA family ATPase [Methanobacterium spitsbergense]
MNSKKNPFKRRTGVLPSYFTGREDELEELKDIFISTKEGDPGNIIIYGPKGIGKTCLLIKFQEELKDVEEVYAIRIPLVEGSFTDIYTLIVDKCADSLDIKVSSFWDSIKSMGVNISYGIGFTLSREIPPTSPSVAIEKILKVIYKKLKGKDPVLILLFDDLQRILINEDTQRVLSILQNALTELNLKGLKIMFVATGAYDIFSRIQEHTDSAVRIFDPYELRPLTLEEVNDAINIPSKKENVTFTQEVIKRIYEISEGNPYYIQVIAHNCFQEANENRVTLVEFDKAFPTSLNFLSQREFRGMYENAANEEKKILDIFIESDSDILVYKEIKENENIKYEPSKVLKTMVEKNLILKKSRGKYKLRDKMFKEYLKKSNNRN